MTGTMCVSADFYLKFFKRLKKSCPKGENYFGPRSLIVFWYLLGVLFEIPDEHPGNFYRRVPREAVTRGKLKVSV